MFCNQCGKRLAADARFCSFCGTPADAAPVEIQAPDTPAPKKNKRGGCLLTLFQLIGVVLLGGLFLAMLSDGGVEIGFTTATLISLDSAERVRSESREAVQPTQTFTRETPEIHVVAGIALAPPGTRVRAEWIFLDNGFNIAEMTTESTDINQNIDFSLVRPPDGWPTGRYEVRILIDDRYDRSALFEVR